MNRGHRELLVRHRRLPVAVAASSFERRCYWRARYIGASHSANWQRPRSEVGHSLSSPIFVLELLSATGRLEEDRICRSCSNADVMICHGSSIRFCGRERFPGTGNYSRQICRPEYCLFRCGTVTGPRTWSATVRAVAVLDPGQVDLERGQ